MCVCVYVCVCVSACVCVCVCVCSRGHLLVGNGFFLLDVFSHIKQELLFMKSHQDCVFCKFFPCKLSYIFS